MTGFGRETTTAESHHARSTSCSYSSGRFRKFEFEFRKLNSGSSKAIECDQVSAFSAIS
jgi:hypothetical protein